LSKKVSIVIITYNQQEFVHETIESCLNQTYDNIEIIVCDDGSSDKTPDVLRQFADHHPDKIRLILHPVNTGIAENSTRGLRVADGDYVIWFGGDDIMFPDKVKHQVNYMESHQEYSACYHDADVFEWPSGKELGLFSRLYGSGVFEIVDIKKYLHPECVLLPSTTMFRREAMQDRYPDVRIKMMNDYLFYAQLLIHGGPFGFLEESLVRYRVSDKSVCKSDNVKQSGFEELFITLAIIEARYPHLSRAVRNRTPKIIFGAAAKQIKFGNTKRFKDLCLLGISRGSLFKGSMLWLFGAPVLKFFYKNQQKYNSMIKFLTKWV
jgi:glycosyltransferase involved in cell wall biosynthesis